MGATKPLRQGNLPADDSMQQYMAYQQEKAASQENPSVADRRQRYLYQQGKAASQGNPPQQEKAASQENPSVADRRQRYLAYQQGKAASQKREMRSGINFGPGRANRVPDQGSPEYEQLLQQVRGLNQGRR